MGSSYIVAHQEVRAITRERTFILLLVIFIGMTLAATYIGWSSDHTIQSVYDSSAILLRGEGKAVPPPPFENRSPLSLLNNMITYVVFIGALLAITVGYLTGIRDRTAGVTRVIFSRNITKNQFLLGKALAIFFVLGSMLVIAASVSTITSIALTQITFADFMRIVGFYGLSLLYLAGFGLLGLLFAVLSRTSTIALLSPIIIWLAVTFVLPELASALYPTASLNPVLPQTDVLQNTVLNVIHAATYPLSISEQFRGAAENVLMLPHRAAVARSFDYPLWLGYLSTPVWVVLCLAASFMAMGRFKQSQGELNE